MPQKTAPKEWTLLVYNAGQGDEGMMCTRNLLDLQRVGSDENTNVIAMNYRSAWWPEKFGKWHDYLGARTYELGPAVPEQPGRIGGELGKLIQLATTSPADIQAKEIAPHQEEVQMGSPETLRQFLLENMARYPARHYAVIISGHGSGFQGQAMMRNPDGKITNPELGKVLEEVSQAAGKKIDLVNLNTCNGAGLEVFHALRNGAEAAVSSQAVVFGATQPMGNVLAELQKELKQGKDVSGAELARKFVQHSRYQELGGLNTPTTSAVELGKMEGLATALGSFHAALMDEGVEPGRIAAWMEQSRRIEYSGIPRLVYIQDVGAFAALVEKECDNPKVRAAAQEVARKLAEGVIDEDHADHRRESPTSMGIRALVGKKASDLSGSTGISVYYDNDVNARGNRLRHLRGSEYADTTQIEKFLKYVSQPADAARAEKSWFSKKLEHFTYEKRILEYKLDKAVNIPLAVPLAKRVLKTAAMIGAGAALSSLGVPTQYFWGAYFGYLAAEKLYKAGSGAVAELSGERTAASNLKLVDHLADLTMGACLGTFAASVGGLLPTSVILPCALIATGARAARYLGQVAINRPHYEAHKREADQFLQTSLSSAT